MFGTEVYMNCSLFWWLDSITHYTVSTTGRRRNENAKYLRALTIYLLIWKFFFPKLYWEKLSNQKSIAMTVGGGHGDLPCCRGVAYLFCVAMRWIKSHLAACGVSNFKLTVFGEKKQLADIIWLKRRSPGSWLVPKQDKLNGIQAVGLLRFPSLKKNHIAFDHQT